MTTQKKIELVERLLNRYEWASWLPFLTSWLELDQGMCKAMKEMTYAIYTLDDIPEVIEAFKEEYPVTAQSKAQNVYLNDELYHYLWFPIGKIKPRINVLKRTLKILEEKQDG